MFMPIRVRGTDNAGCGYHDIDIDSGIDVNRIVNVVMNPQNPVKNGYPRLPRFEGALQVDNIARLVFVDGDKNLGAFDARVIVDK